jgi:hypothetical protein
MGLQPTHGDESALLTPRVIPNGLCNDFRRSVMATFANNQIPFRMMRTMHGVLLCQTGPSD